MGKLIISDYNLAGAAVAPGIEIDITIPIPLTKSISDVMFPETRQGEWSKTITIQGYSEVNKAFTHIYEINETITSDTQYDPSFNPNKRANVIYQSDGVVQMRGYIRLIEINKILETSEIQYQCQIINNVSDFFADISGKSMADIDLTRYNHVITKELVRKSWDQNIIDGGVQIPFAKGTGYVHALINKRPYKGTIGSTDPTTSWDVGDTTPCLYAKELVDKIYADAGATYASGGFFDSAEFKNWVVPYNGRSLGLTNADIDFYRVQAQSTATQTTGGLIAPETSSVDLVFSNDSTSGNQDNSNSWNTSPIQGIFTAQVDGNYGVLLDTPITISYSGALRPVKITSTLVATNTTTGARYFSQNGIAYTQKYTPAIVLGGIQLYIESIPVKSGESLTFSLECYGNANSSGVGIASLAIGATLFIQPKTLYYGSGSTVDFQEFYDRKITQKQFMVDLIRTFNLWIDVNNQGEHVVETRDNYLGTDVTDLEDVINTDKEVSYLPMGALDARKYIFTYKEDKDSLNELYKFRNEMPYGTKEFDVDNDFIKTDKEIKVSYSPTPMRYFDTSGMTLSDITFYDKQGGQDKEKKSNYRLLRYEGIENCNPYHLEDSAGINIETGYPLIGHINDPLNPTLDGLFGMLDQHYLNPLIKYSNNTLWFQYYLKQYKEITDRNSKIVKAWLNIGEDLYPNMTFDKIYYFDNAYFRLNKIYDYKPKEDTLCEFLKLVEYTKPATENGQEGGWDDTDTFSDYFPTPSSILNGSGNTGFNRGADNTMTDTAIAIGNNNTYGGIGLVSIMSSSNVNVADGVTQTTVINSDGLEVQENGLYINGVNIIPNDNLTVFSAADQIADSGGTPKEIFFTGNTLNGDSLSVSGNEITIERGGLYSITMNAQIYRTSGGSKQDFYMWVEGDTGSGFSALPNSARHSSTLNSGETFIVPMEMNQSFNAGDILKFMFEVSSTNIYLNYEPASGSRPEVNSFNAIVRRVL